MGPVAGTRFVDLSSFERVAAERRVGTLIQQAALQDGAVGADVELRADHTGGDAVGVG